MGVRLSIEIVVEKFPTASKITYVIAVNSRVQFMIFL